MHFFQHRAPENAPSDTVQENASSNPSSSSGKEDLAYNTAGGGAASFQPTPHSLLSSVFAYLHEEGKRPSRDPVLVRGPDLHQRLPVWMEDKDVNIVGEKLSPKEIEDVGRWRGKYRKELEIADAVIKVKSQRIKELDHDILWSVEKVRRWLGYSPPLDENFAKKEAEAQWEAKLHRENLGTDTTGSATRKDGAHVPSSFPTSPSKGGASTAAEVEYGALIDGPPKRNLQTAWQVFLTTAKTGRPLAQVASDFRPHIDFYGLDAFLDNRLSLVWFWMKIGMFIGLAQGTARAAQAISSDLSFLRASGVGVLSVLNLSAFAGIVKWGGNFAMLSSAFCVGDSMVSGVRSLFFPRHEVRIRNVEELSVTPRRNYESSRAYRTTANYVGGFACAGGMVGVMPWWILQDTSLAGRLCLSGMCVGSGLGLVVGMLLQRMVALNLTRLDASPRHFRRYEALLLRQRDWVEGEVRASEKNAIVWW